VSGGTMLLCSEPRRYAIRVQGRGGGGVGRRQVGKACEVWGRAVGSIEKKRW